MIDWARGMVPFLHTPLPAGRVLGIYPDGEVEWTMEKKLEIRGSHESVLKVKSAGRVSTIGNYRFIDTLEFDGNLAKFLQGHNVAGSRDIKLLLLKSFQKVYNIYFEHLEGWSSKEQTEARISKGDFDIRMVDINQLYDVGNDESVESWLHAAEMRCRTRTGRALKDKGTVYLQKHSRRWAIKFYNKLREISAKKKSHRLPEELRGLGIEQWLKGKLRAELRLMSLELKELGIRKGSHLTEQVIERLFQKYMGRLEMNTKFSLIDAEMVNLPRVVQSTYLLWRQGCNLREMLPKNTYYRHRKILNETGIDINFPNPSTEHTNIIPLIRVIEAKPVKVPEWFYEKGLIAC